MRGVRRDALAAGEIDAFVYDHPILAYLVRQGHARTLRVLPASFNRQDYAFGVPPGSPLREPIHRAVLELVAGEQSRVWSELERKYLD